jgi:hypothetical protein
MTIEWGEEGAGPTPELPTDISGWVHYFPTMDVALVRSENFMTTVTAYDYQDLKKTYKSKYMHRPAGGSISNLWVKDYGFLQLGGQTEYHRWEPMHFPEADSLLCITPRIEFSNENGYFTNLYEFDGRMTVEAAKDKAVAVITTSGELSDKKLLPGGVAFTLQHVIYDDAVEKRVLLRYHDGNRTVKIIEPIVMQENLIIRAIDERTVQISNDKRSFVFEVLEGNVRITLGKDRARFWSVYPSVKAFPIELTVLKPDDKFLQRVHYRIKIIG